MCDEHTDTLGRLAPQGKGRQFDSGFLGQRGDQRRDVEFVITRELLQADPVLFPMMERA